MPQETSTQLPELFEMELFLATAGIHRAAVSFSRRAGIFAQGDSCDSIFFVEHGSIKLTVLSEMGKVATIALLNPGDFVRGRLPGLGSAFPLGHRYRANGLRPAAHCKSRNDTSAPRPA